MLRSRTRTFVIAAGAGAALATSAVYLKLRSTDMALRASGEFAGLAYPEDALNRRVKAFRPFEPTKALVAERQAPQRIERLAPNRLLVDFGRAAFGALRVTTTANRDIEVIIGERRVAGAGVGRHRAEDGARSLRIAHYRTRATQRAGRPLLVGGPLRVRPTAAELPAGLSSVMPFRYAEIGGIEPEKLRVERIAVHYPFDETAAEFRSSSADLDRVWELSKHTLKATSFAGLYVDGNRERKPYEGDAYITQLGHYNVDTDFGLARRTLQFLLRNPTWPTEWTMFPISLAYNDYLYSGDKRFLSHVYPQLAPHILLALARADGLVDTRDPARMAVAARMLGTDGPLVDLIDWPVSERDGFERVAVPPQRFWRLSASLLAHRIMAGAAELFGFHHAEIYYAEVTQRISSERYHTPAVNTVINAFHFMSLMKMAYLAEQLGRDDEATFYGARAALVQRALRAKLFDARRGLFVDGEGSRHTSLHANMFPLAFALVDPAAVPDVRQLLISKGMAGSPYAAQFLLDALYAAGAGDHAFALLTSRSERSWLAMIERTGSTMTTEAWSDRIKPNQDWSHAWSSAPANVIPRWLMGIRPLSPGFGSVIIQPQPGPLRQASIKLPTVRGAITVDFTAAPASFSMRVTLPPGVVAQLYAPPEVTRSPRLSVTVDDAAVQPRATARGLFLGEVGAGQHRVLIRRG